jgi:NADPH:quinone reductase-like Zn-dependent oxidoreductase
MNHLPSATTRVLAPNGTFIPNSVGNKRGFFTGGPRMAPAALMKLGKTDVQFAGDWASRDNLLSLADLLESGDVKVVIDKVYPLSEAGRAVAHMLGHRAQGNIVLNI